jgi:hypothetical protein
MVATEASASRKDRPTPTTSAGKDTTDTPESISPIVNDSRAEEVPVLAQGEMELGADLDTWWNQLGSTSPPSASNTVSSLTSMLGIDLQSDFSSGLVDFDFDPTMSAAQSAEASGPALDDSMTTAGAAMDGEQQLEAAEIAGVDIVHYVRQLADLNVRLCEHMSMLPPLHNASSTKGIVPSPNGIHFPIDETFSLTQSLIDHLKHLYPPNSVLHPPCTPDQGTILLLMSCSGRVFDIYEVIFGHMRGCINHNITPVTSTGKTILLPQVRIGAYTPPKAAAIAMQMLLIVLLAAELFDQLQEALGVWRHRRGPPTNNSSHALIEGLGHATGAVAGPERRYPDFTEDTRSEMERRATTVAAEIGNMRQRLLSLPGMAGAAALQSLLASSG